MSKALYDRLASTVYKQFFRACDWALLEQERQQQRRRNKLNKLAALARELHGRAASKPASR